MEGLEALTAADRALDALHDAASFAGAEHGNAHAESLMHYHRALTRTLTDAFDASMRARDLTLPKRDQAALRAYAVAIAMQVSEDAEAVQQRHRDLITAAIPKGPGAKHLVDATFAALKMQAGQWWDGHMPLGQLKSAAIAKQDWKTYRKAPAWVPYVAIGGGIGASAAVAMSLFL